MGKYYDEPYFIDSIDFIEWIWNKNNKVLRYYIANYDKSCYCETIQIYSNNFDKFNNSRVGYQLRGKRPIYEIRMLIV